MNKQIRKATGEQKRAYRGLYPLYGYVTISGHECPIEFPNEGREEPKYELRAPTGYRFEEGLHGYLETTLATLRTTISYAEVVPCEDDCDCGESLAGKKETA